MNWTKVNRQGIEMVFLDAQRRTLLIKWRQGGYEAWGNVDPVEAANMAQAPMPKTYFEEFIRPAAQRLPGERSGELGLVKPPN